MIKSKFCAFVFSCFLFVASFSTVIGSAFADTKEVLVKKDLISPADFYEPFGHRFSKPWEVSGNPYMIVGLTDEIKARGGKYSVRAVVGKDYGLNQITRAESSLRISAGYGWMKNIPVGKDRWYGFSVFVPGNFVPDVEGHQDIFFQIIDTDFRHLTLPVVALSIEGNRFNVAARGGQLDKSMWSSEKSRNFGQVVAGTWNDFVIKLRIDDGRYGQLYVYHNGKAVFDHQGAVGRLSFIKTLSDEMKPTTKYRTYRAKIGLEKPEWRNPKEIKRSADIGVDYRILYFDELRVTDGDDSYQIVDPAREPSNPVLWLKQQESKPRKPKSDRKYAPSKAVLTSAVATASSSIAISKMKYNNEGQRGRAVKKIIVPSAKTTKSIEERNADGSPVIRQIEFVIVEDKVTRGNEITLKWRANGNNVKKCRRSGGWSGLTTAEGEYVIEKARPHVRFEITCGWGKGMLSRTIMLVPNAQQAKLQHSDNSITFIEIN